MINLQKDSKVTDLRVCMNSVMQGQDPCWLPTEFDRWSKAELREVEIERCNSCDSFVEPTDRIARIKMLHDAGVMTHEEFKSALLDAANSIKKLVADRAVTIQQFKDEVQKSAVEKEGV